MTVIGRRSEADIAGEETEKVLAELRALPAAWFTVDELFYVYYWTTNVRWGTSAQSERKSRDAFAEMLKVVKERKGVFPDA